ncbi:MAG: DUF1566 domain-containing protein [Deltaproteobacteria bacterium]|nr:DUF1566 domain-containing protein [Deltaproteobacteria bacterium]
MNTMKIIFCITVIFLLTTHHVISIRAADQNSSEGVVVADSRIRPSSIPTTRVLKRKGAYIIYANGIVKDTRTGLEWFVGPDKNMTWDEADSWVKRLNLSGGGWRMPTLDELGSLYKKGAGPRNMTPFLKTSGWWVWSGETVGSSEARSFAFGHGFRGWIFRGNSASERVFAVRSRGRGFSRK